MEVQWHKKHAIRFLKGLFPKQRQGKLTQKMAFRRAVEDKVGSPLVVQMVKRLPTMRETRVQSLGQEDLLEKEMATHSTILVWKIPWMEEPGGL